MKKFLSLIAATALLSFCASAETLSPQAALQRAARSGVAKAASKATKAMELVYTENTLGKNPAVYVFQQGKSDGYLLVAADDVAIPVLGYADSGSFDEKTMAPGLKAWLQDYARQIQYAVTMGGNVPTSYDKQVLGDAVAPLVKTKWNQGYPYNLDTPLDNGANSVTGCVATAMAQVMNYWKWPAVGHGKVSASVRGIVQPSINLADYPFDWENMADEYNAQSTQKQMDAVARLMLCCGFSVNMGYSSDESGAPSINLVTALVNNFDYNKNIQLLDRNFYSGSDWNRIVYEELKAGRPVLYAGSSLTGAHQFVVDGYNADGYFHLNWGWGGSSDGYFSLNALEPGSQGIGGSAGGYNYGQSIIQGVQIKETEAVEQQEYAMVLGNGGIKGTVNGLRMYITTTTSAWLSNGTSETLTGTMGVLIEGVTDPSYSAQVESWSLNGLQPGYGYPTWSLSDVMFPDAAPDGKYKVTMAFLKKPDMKWIPVRCPDANYFYVTKKGNTLTVENPAATSTLKVTCEMSDVIYTDSSAAFKFTAKNESDHEITQGVYPALYDYSGNMVYDCEGFMLTLQPGEEITKEFTGTFHLRDDQTGIGNASSADYIFRYFDPISWQPYMDTETYVTMMALSGNLGLRILDIKVVGVAQGDISDGTINKTGYKIENAHSIPFEIKVQNTGSAYWIRPIYVAFWDKYNSKCLQTSALGNAVAMNPRESATVTGYIDFNAVQGDPNDQNEKIFIVNALYKDKNNDWQWPQSNIPSPGIWIFVDEKSGVSDVFVDSDVISISYNKAASQVAVNSEAEINSVKVFSIDGAAHAVDPAYDGNSATVSVADLQPGVYVVVATDASGAKKALKIVK